MAAIVKRMSWSRKSPKLLSIDDIQQNICDSSKVLNLGDEFDFPPYFQVLPNQFDIEKEVQRVNEDENLVNLIREQKLFLVTEEAARLSVDGNVVIDFYDGVNIYQFYYHCDYPESNRYAGRENHERAYLMEGALKIKDAFELAGARRVRVCLVSHFETSSKAERESRLKLKVPGVTKVKGKRVKKEAGDFEEYNEVLLDQYFSHPPKKLSKSPSAAHWFDPNCIRQTNAIIKARLDDGNYKTEKWKGSTSFKLRNAGEKSGSFGMSTKVLGFKRGKKDSTSSTTMVNFSLEVEFFTEDEITQHRSKTMKTPLVRMDSSEANRVREQLGFLIKTLDPENCLSKSSISALVIGEKGAGKSSFIWTVHRAFQGRLGYHSIYDERPMNGMDIPVYIPERRFSDATDVTLFEKDVFRKIDASQIDFRLHSMTKFPVKWEEKELTCEFKMIDSRGMFDVLCQEKSNKKRKALVEKFGGQMLNLPDCAFLVLDGYDLLEDDDEFWVNARETVLTLSTTMNSKKDTQNGFPVFVVLTRLDLMRNSLKDEDEEDGEVGDSSDEEKEGWEDGDSSDEGEQLSEHEVCEKVKELLNCKPVCGVIFLQNFLRPSKDEVEGMQELYERATENEEDCEVYNQEMNQCIEIYKMALEAVSSLHNPDNFNSDGI